MNPASPRAERETLARQFVNAGVESMAPMIGQCFGLTDEKRALAQKIMVRDLSSPHLLPLIRHLDPETLGKMMTQCFGDAQRRELLLEIARHHPGLVRPHFDRIPDEQIRAAARAGAPDEWADRLREAYQRDQKVQYIKELGEIYTDRALTHLIKMSEEVPHEQMPMIALAIENCGAFYNTQVASLYADAFRAYVVSRDESPHHFGSGLNLPVPMCTFCSTPAERLITIDAEATRDAFELEVSPSFFWYRCPCDNGNMIYTRYADNGLVGMKVAMTDGPVESPTPYGSFALERFSRDVVAAHPARPGAGEHQVGGFPTWIRKNFFPSVPDIGSRTGMMFLCSIDLAAVPLGWVTGHQGIVYCFWDYKTRTAVSQLQIKSEEGGLFGF